MRQEDTSLFQINMRLFTPFVDKLKELYNKYPEQFSKLNGLSEDNLNFNTFIDSFAQEDTLADVTIDGNANASVKDICSMDIEMSKPHKKLLSLHKIYYEIYKEYGKEKADMWLEEEWNGASYLHDAYSASFKPYCFAYTLEDLVNKGLYFVKANGFNSEAPKHLMTYVRDVLEFVSWTSNRTSGACGLPDFLIYSFYFWKHDVENGYFLLNPEYYRDQGFQEIIYGLNQPYLRVNQSAFTNFTIMDRHYLIEMFGDKVFPDGTCVIDYIDDILDYQIAFLEEVSRTRKKTMFTFPVLTFSLLKKKDIDMSRVGDWDYSVFEDEEYARRCSKHNMLWADSNFFSDDKVTSLSSCCRLVNDFSKLTGFINSIGGTQLKIGSVKVNTINLARIALEAEGDEEKYFEILEERVDTCVKTLDRIRHIIKRNIEKGFLPNYSYKLIELKNQYNTIGINGMFEAVRSMGGTDVDEFGNITYNQYGDDFSCKILDFINEKKDSYGFDYSINIEAVPAERCAVILLSKDRILYGDKITSNFLYGNQWIPLDEKCSISEKVRLGSMLDKKCGGGQIMHVNVSGDFADEQQAWSILNKIVAQGVIYFAFNKVISLCENGHGFFGDTCPECGGPKVDESMRIVGFLTPRSSYSEARKKESARRYFYDLNDNLF